jgi:coenzyme F420-reducing hydrogenase delta subunit
MKPKLTVFYCINTFPEVDALPIFKEDACDVKTVKLACSGMVEKLYLLKAFEDGADAVVVMACPEERCRYLEGSRRAGKRVEWVKHLLDEIQLDGRRLLIANIEPGDERTASALVQDALSVVSEIGPNPAR